MSLAVHGDDFTFCGLEEDLDWITELMASWFEIKIRGTLEREAKDDKEATILGRVVRWVRSGIEYEADPKHRDKVLEYFGLVDGSKGLTCNGDKEDREELGEEIPMGKAEAKEFRGLVARVNFMSLDCPDLQFSIKQCSREMANPTQGAWKRLKKVARYLLGRRSLVWKFGYQNESRYSTVVTDSDWGF